MVVAPENSVGADTLVELPLEYVGVDTICRRATSTHGYHSRHKIGGTGSVLLSLRFKQYRSYIFADGTRLLVYSSAVRVDAAEKFRLDVEYRIDWRKSRQPNGRA